ncbi:hypothetical protein RCH13_001878 [Chryseobacterium sp. MP_3.2]|nr:hypothetical protein [Chryseobacterium sp. MP_3.2]
MCRTFVKGYDDCKLTLTSDNSWTFAQFFFERQTTSNSSPDGSGNPAIAIVQLC